MLSEHGCVQNELLVLQVVWMLLLETDGFIQAVHLLLLVFNKSNRSIEYGPTLAVEILDVLIIEGDDSFVKRLKYQLLLILHFESQVKLHHFVMVLRHDESVEAMLKHGDDSNPDDEHEGFQLNHLQDLSFVSLLIQYEDHRGRAR